LLDGDLDAAATVGGHGADGRFVSLVEEVVDGERRSEALHERNGLPPV
jgi:hypothetical protein